MEFWYPPALLGIYSWAIMAKLDSGYANTTKVPSFAEQCYAKLIQN